MASFAQHCFCEMWVTSSLVFIVFVDQIHSNPLYEDLTTKLAQEKKKFGVDFCGVLFGEKYCIPLSLGQELAKPRLACHWTITAM